MDEPLLVSACLLGALCRYDGRRKTNHALLNSFIGKQIILICPECMGGLPVPRPPVRFLHGTGAGVLRGDARIINTNGTDCTEAFLEGAYRVRNLARSAGVKTAILKARSPSCGKGVLSQPDGSIIEGNGVATELLLQSGVSVVSCEFDSLPEHWNPPSELSGH